MSSRGRRGPGSLLPVGPRQKRIRCCVGVGLTCDHGGREIVEGEKIKRGRIIVNALDSSVQLGALPPPGSRAERFGAMLQHLKARRMRRQAG